MNRKKKILKKNKFDYKIKIKKVDRQKINVTVDCPNSTKICLTCWRYSYIYIVLFGNLSPQTVTFISANQTLSFFKKHFLTIFTKYSTF